MRWSQGFWSEQRLMDAVNASGEFYCIPYGPSGIAPKDPEEYEAYFDRLDATGLGDVKRPDLLVFPGAARDLVSDHVEALGGLAELPFIPEEGNDDLSKLLDLAVVAIEAENSLWVAEQMPDWGAELKPMKRLGDQPGLAKNAIVPTVIVKEQDKGPLDQWQSNTRIPIHIWHTFFDRAFGLSLGRVDTLVSSGLVEATEYPYTSAGGIVTIKRIFRIYYHHAYELGLMTKAPDLVADSLTDPNGHIFPYVRFEGGVLELAESALSELRSVTPRTK